MFPGIMDAAYFASTRYTLWVTTRREYLHNYWAGVHGVRTQDANAKHFPGHTLSDEQQRMCNCSAVPDLCRALHAAAVKLVSSSSI